MTFNELVQNQGKNKKEIAAHLECSRQSLWLWAKEGDMPLNKVAKVANFLQVPIKEVVESILHKQYSVFEA